MPPKSVLPVRVDQGVKQRLHAYMETTGKTQSQAMLDALELLLSGGSHAQFAPPVPVPTEAQRAGMRARTLYLLKSGKEYTPQELARILGCGEGAASAYCRDLRKSSYGSHCVISRPDVVNGRRVSFYRLEVQS